MNLILLAIFRTNVEARAGPCTLECTGAYCHIKCTAAYVYTLKNKTLLCKHRMVEALIKASPFLLQDSNVCDRLVVT